MNNQDKELIILIQDVIAGKAEKKELCNRIYKEVYALSYPVYKNDEKSMTQTKKALIEICNQVADINLSKNVHKQIATIASAYFLMDAVNENEDGLKNSSSINEYEYSRIREDEELLGYMKKKANAFRSPKVFDEQDEEFRSLNSVLMALVELYAYEMQSVDAIERMTDVDSSYIGSWIADIRNAVLDYSVAEDDKTEEVKDSNAESDADISEADEEEYDSAEEEYADEEDYSDEYEEQRAVSSVYSGSRGHRENSVTLFLRKLFPALSLPARKAISWAAGCVVVIALVSALFVSVIAGANNRKNTNKDYEYQSMQYYTNKQSTTKKNNGTTAAGTDAQTTEEAQTDEKTTAEKTTEEKTTEEENNRDDATVRTENDTTAGEKDTDNESTEEGGSGSGSTGESGSGSGNTGESGSGSGNTGEGGSGSGNTGESGSGSGNTGESGSGSGNTGEGGSGSGNTGESGSGSGNTGESGSGSGNTGESGSGSGSAGEGGSGSGSTGEDGSGSGSTGEDGSGSSDSSDDKSDDKADNLRNIIDGILNLKDKE